MRPYDLPTSIRLGGVDYAIRTDYRDILDILIAQSDPDLRPEDRAIIMFEILYPEHDKIPREYLEEALQKAVDFIDCGQTSETGGRKPTRLMDWEQDAQIIIPAINTQIKTEVREIPYMHWWTFLGYYMSIGEGLFATVVGIRSKKAHGKKLEKYESEFLRENRDLVVLKEKRSTDDVETAKQDKEAIERFLKGGG